MRRMAISSGLGAISDFILANPVPLAEDLEVVARVARHDPGEGPDARPACRSRCPTRAHSRGVETAQDGQVRLAHERELVRPARAAGPRRSAPPSTYWFSSNEGSAACSPRLMQKAR